MMDVRAELKRLEQQQAERRYWFALRKLQSEPMGRATPARLGELLGYRECGHTVADALMSVLEARGLVMKLYRKTEHVGRGRYIRHFWCAKR